MLLKGCRFGGVKAAEQVAPSSWWSSVVFTVAPPSRLGSSAARARHRRPWISSWRLGPVEGRGRPRRRGHRTIERASAGGGHRSGARERGLTFPRWRIFSRSPAAEHRACGRPRAVVGKPAFMSAQHVADRQLETKHRRCNRRDKRWFLARSNQAAGIIAMADPIKETNLARLETCTSSEGKIIMLTGDNAAPRGCRHQARHR